ncbi:hypothetical protein KEM54_002732 [Ascosphaera aggregata]|nr:hypothetical protein KEM54_002732 [Ascosphaera aggregata]
MVTREDDGGDDPPSFYQSSQGQLQFPFLNEDDAGIDYRYIHGAGPSINLPLRQRETSAPPTAFLTTSPIFHAPPPFTSHHSARESYFSSQQIRVSNCYPESPSEGLRTRFVSGSQLGNGQSTSEHHPQTEDKQELERQRLLAAASVPEPTFYNQYGDSRAASSDALAGTRSNTNMAVPPNVLTEEDLLHQTPATDALPRYRL